VRQLEDPIDTAIFAALIDYYRNATPNTISFSDVLNEKVAPLDISPEQVLESPPRRALTLTRRYALSCRRSVRGSPPRWRRRSSGCQAGSGSCTRPRLVRRGR
jgi:hypothetical protein